MSLTNSLSPDSNSSFDSLSPEEDIQVEELEYEELVDVASEIKDVDALVIFGPAEIKDKFMKELSTSYKDLSVKVKDVVKTDSMTTPQVKAWVKAFYKESRL